MSPDVFQISQILDMAVRAEVQGRRFYQACRDRVESEEAADIFEFLMEQESKHADTFQRMQERTNDTPLPESYAGEAESYAASFVRGRIFDNPSQAAEQMNGAEGPLQVIDLALGFERKSINFYEDMKKWVPSSEHVILDDVIGEEQNHIKRLNELRAKLAGE